MIVGNISYFGCMMAKSKLGLLIIVVHLIGRIE